MAEERVDHQGIAVVSHEVGHLLVVHALAAPGRAQMKICERAGGISSGLTTWLVGMLTPRRALTVTIAGIVAESLLQYPGEARAYPWRTEDLRSATHDGNMILKALSGHRPLRLTPKPSAQRHFAFAAYVANALFRNVGKLPPDTHDPEGKIACAAMLANGWHAGYCEHGVPAQRETFLVLVAESLRILFRALGVDERQEDAFTVAAARLRRAAEILLARRDGHCVREITVTDGGVRTLIREYEFRRSEILAVVAESVRASL